MHPDADLSPHGIGGLQVDFLEALDLRELTLVGNDSGLFQLAAAAWQERIARLVITACEAFENFPPGLPGKSLVMSAKLPGGAWMAAPACASGSCDARRSPTDGWSSARSPPTSAARGSGRSSRAKPLAVTFASTCGPPGRET